MSKKLPKQKPPTMYQEYLDALGNRHYLKEKFLEELGDALVEFSLNCDGSKGFRRFICTKGIHWRTFQNWLKTDERLRMCYETAKGNMGETREELALKKVYEPGLTKFTLFNYLPEYAEIQKTINVLGGDTDQATQKIVLIEKITELAKIEADGNK